MQEHSSGSEAHFDGEAQKYRHSGLTDIRKKNLATENSVLKIS